MKLTDDYVQLEKIEVPTPIIQLDRSPAPSVVRAKVIAVGPGDHSPTGRYPMPCKAGDTVFASSGAGIQFKEGGRDYWFVYAGRKDILAVLDD